MTLAGGGRLYDGMTLAGTTRPGRARPLQMQEEGRVCATHGCSNLLSRYNPAHVCEPCKTAQRTAAATTGARKKERQPMPVRVACRRVHDGLMRKPGSWATWRQLLPYGTADDVRRAVASLRRLGLNIEGRGGVRSGYRLVTQNGGPRVSTSGR